MVLDAQNATNFPIFVFYEYLISNLYDYVNSK